MTCGHVLADKWEYYEKKCQEALEEDSKKSLGKKVDKYFDGVFTKKILDDMGLYKQCCRRHMLGHVDLIETI